MATTQTATLRLNMNPSTSLTTQPTAAPTASLPQKRTRPYRDFLTPALHRRFGRAALLTLAVCYIESMLISPPSLVWFWNPISLTGIRAILLFLPCLAVFIVRVANIHCGELLAPSPASFARAQSFGWKGLHTLGWYLFGAFLFSEIYIWSQDRDARLTWVDAGREDEWALLNENPIFMRAMFTCLAVSQTVVHLINDYDMIPIPVKEVVVASSTGNGQHSPTVRLPPPFDELSARLPQMALRTAKLTLPTLALTFPAYFICLRALFWPYFYTIGRVLFPKLAAQTRPTGLTHVMPLLWQCLSASTMLVVLWEVSSATFTAFVARPPLSKTEDQPLTGLMATNDKMRDPNESLISGLKSKKEPPKAFAFWELKLICTKFDARRKTIYTEVDRANGTTWSQISRICLDEISAIQTRIQAVQQPAPQAAQIPASLTTQQQQQDYRMPKIADRAVQTGDVWTKQRSTDFAQHVSSIAKSAGQNHGAESPILPQAKKAIEWSANQVMSREDQARLSPGSIAVRASNWAMGVLQTPLGEPFRRTFARSVSMLVLGTPYSAKANIVNASRALAALCAHSLKEDDYAQVAKSVALIVRTYTDTIRAIEKYVHSAKPDWTDVYFSDSSRNVQEIDEVVNILKEGLEQVVLVFGEYQSSIGVTKKELREARELVASGKKPEMITAR